MSYLSYDVSVAGPRVVEVTLDHAANVRVVDDLNFSNYKRGWKFWFRGGGWFDRSPIRLLIPEGGSWHVVVDNPFGGRVAATFRLL